MKSAITILDILWSCPIGVHSFLYDFWPKYPEYSRGVFQCSLFLDKCVINASEIYSRKSPRFLEVFFPPGWPRGSRSRCKNTTGSNQNTSGCFRPRDNWLPLCTGSVSCCRFLNCSVQRERKREGGGGSGGPLEGVGPENHIKLATCSTEYRIQNTPVAKLINSSTQNCQCTCFLYGALT